jgi:hypothetical protein
MVDPSRGPCSATPPRHVHSGPSRWAIDGGGVVRGPHNLYVVVQALRARE